jgi:hypothetical protein
MLGEDGIHQIPRLAMPNNVLETTPRSTYHWHTAQLGLCLGQPKVFAMVEPKIHQDIRCGVHPRQVLAKQWPHPRDMVGDAKLFSQGA